MGNTKAAEGSEVKNVKHVQPAGGIADFNPDTGILRPEYARPSHSSYTRQQAPMLTQV